MEQAKKTLLSFGMAFLLAFAMLGIAPLQAIAAEGESLKADVNEDGGYVYDVVYGVNDGYAAMVKTIAAGDGVATQTDLVKGDGTVSVRSIVPEDGASIDSETDIEIVAESFGQLDGMVKFIDRGTSLQGVMTAEGEKIIPATYRTILLDGNHQVIIAISYETIENVTVDLYHADGSPFGKSVSFPTSVEPDPSVRQFCSFNTFADYVCVITQVGAGEGSYNTRQWLELTESGLILRDDLLEVYMGDGIGGGMPYMREFAVLSKTADSFVVEYNPGGGADGIEVYSGNVEGYVDASGEASYYTSVVVSNGVVLVDTGYSPDGTSHINNERWAVIDVQDGKIVEKSTVGSSNFARRVGGKFIVARYEEGSPVYKLQESLAGNPDTDIVFSGGAYVLADDLYACDDVNGSSILGIKIYKDGQLPTEEPALYLESDRATYFRHFTPGTYRTTNNVQDGPFAYYSADLKEITVPFDVSYFGPDPVEAGELNGSALYLFQAYPGIYYPETANIVIGNDAQLVAIGGYTLAPTCGGVVADEATVQRGDMYYATDGDGKYGAVRAGGEVAIPFEYDGVEDMGREDENLILLKKGDAWYFFDTEAGEPAPEPEPEPEPTPDPDSTPVPTPDPESEVDVVENPDGSTTTTVKDPDGTVTETTEAPDGTVTEKVESPDGTVTEKVERPDGSSTQVVEAADGSKATTETTTAGVVGTVETDADGAVTGVSATVPESAAEEAEGAIELPVAQVPADGSLKVEVSAPAGTKVVVPVATAAGGEGGEGETPEPSPGLVVVVVAADGTETVLPKSAAVEGGIAAELPGDCTIVVEDRSADFPDMVGDEWYAEQGVADFMSSRGIVTGVETEGGSLEFQGDAPLDRGMMATLLYRVEGEPEVSGEGSFGDVEGGQWYTDAAEWAASAGVVTGYEGGEDDGDFGAADPVTREQMAAMLFRYAGALGVDTSARADLSATPDGASASGFAAEAMSWAVAEGIFRGDDGTGAVRPLDGATRAEASVVVMRFVELILGA